MNPEPTSFTAFSSGTVRRRVQEDWPVIPTPREPSRIPLLDGHCKVATLELSDRGVCPACTQLGAGGYVSFEGDLRLAFACPTCRKLVWMAGA